MKDFKVVLSSTLVGDDLLVTLTGGDAPHAGAVAFAGPYDGIYYSSVISKPGHKESDLAKEQAERIAKVLGKSVVLVAGVHINNASRADIDMLVKNSVSAVDKFLGVRG